MFNIPFTAGNSTYSELTIKTSTKIIDIDFAKSKASMIESLIYDLICNLTSLGEEPNEESSSQLDKYFSNKQHVDTVYSQVLKRIRDELLIPQIVFKCIELMKKHFKTNPPSLQILVQIDQICSIVIQDAIITNKMHLKTVSYLCKSVNEHVNSEYDSEMIKEYQAAKIKAEKDRKSHKRGGEHRVQSSFVDVQKPSQGGEIVSNFYAIRSHNKIPTKSILLSILFGGQFRKVTKFEDKLPEIELMYSLKEEDSKFVHEKIEQIKTTKKSFKTRIQSYFDMTPSILFTKEEINEPDIPPHVFQVILENIACPPNKQDLENALNILVHILGGWLCSDSTSAFQMSRYLFFELLDSNRDARARAYQIIYNLLLFVREKNYNVMKDLWGRFCEMTLFSLFKETDHSIWTTIFMILNVFLNDKNFFKQYLSSLDIRVVCKLISVFSTLEERVEKCLLNVLINMMYTTENELMYTQLDKIGGIDTILDYLTTIHSLDSKQNLFLILFDYICNSLIVKKKISKKQAEALLVIVSQCDISYYFDQIFKFLPDTFVESLSRFLYVELLIKEKELRDLQEIIGNTEIVSLVLEIYDLACNYIKMEDEIITRCLEMYKELNSAEHLKVLKLLLASEVVSEKRNGEAMLFSLLQCEKLTDLTKLGELVMNQLASEKRNPIVYCNIVEKMMLYKRSQFTVHKDERLKHLMEFMNTSLLMLVQANEGNQQAIKKMFYVIMDFFSVVMMDRKVGVDDDICAMYRSGMLCLPLHLVRQVNSNVLYYIFTHVMDENIKITSLILLCEVCKKKSHLESIGGLKIFTKLLEDSNAAVAYYSAKFLLGQFVKYIPKVFYANLASLTSRAQLDGNIMLLQNEYYQCLELLK